MRTRRHGDSGCEAGKKRGPGVHMPARELRHREGIVSLAKWSDVSVFEVLFEEMMAVMGVT